jgi:plastocyanin
MGDRQRRTRLIRALCGGVVLALCGTAATLAASESVSISGFAFTPTSVTVSIGDTVTWTNSDAVVHTATADDGSWDAGNIPAGGGTGAVVFTAAGSFPYHCTIHTQMTGSVTVLAAATTTAPTAGTTMAPSDTAPIVGTDDRAGGGWLTALVIGALAATVGLAVLLRNPARAVAERVPSAVVVVGGAAVIPMEQVRAGRQTPTRRGSVAPIVVVAIASAVAVAMVWRRLTAGR